MERANKAYQMEIDMIDEYLEEGNFEEGIVEAKLLKNKEYQLLRHEAKARSTLVQSDKEKNMVLYLI